MATESRKRKAPESGRSDDAAKKAKGRKQWSMPRRVHEDRAILPGDTGIWATCAMKKEAKSVVDLRGLFQEYADTIYGAHGDTPEPDTEDIEDEINKEIASIQKPDSKPLFVSVKLDTQCLVFFKTREPIEPVRFVERICQDAATGIRLHNCRFVKRLTPMTAFEKATVQGIETLAKKVLEPHFHLPGQTGIKFAIRPTFRNNKNFTRDGVIKMIAATVGPSHQVDLKNYDRLILVEVYQNIVGMSVVGADFDKLKRFNIEELCQAAAPSRGSGGDATAANAVKTQ